MDKRKIGFWGAVTLIIANMIGTGVFTTSGYSLASLENPNYVLFAWLFGGLISLAGAVSYGALGCYYQESGGEYLILSRTFHPTLGFLAGWVSLLAGFSAPIAASAHALEAYAGLQGAYWPGATAIIFSGLIHSLSVKKGVQFQAISVFLKVAFILIFIFISLLSNKVTYSNTDLNYTSDISDFFVTIIWIMFSYSGWNASLYLASEIKNPKKTLIRASVIAIIIVTVLYLFLNYIFMFSAPIEKIAGQASIGKIAAESIGGQSLGFFLTIIIVIALFTSISSMVMTGPRVYAQMARDRVFPRFFEFKGEAPTRAITLQVALALVMFSMSSLVQLMSYIGYLLSISSVLTVLSIFKLKHEVKPYIPFYPLPPVIFVLISSIAALFFIYKEPLQALYGLISIFIGLVFYYGPTRFKKE